MTKKQKYLKTVYGSPILPLHYINLKSSKLISNLVWLKAHPEDGSKAFFTSLQVIDIEGGEEAVDAFFEEYGEDS